MASKVKTTPDGWHSVTPFLSVRDAARAVEFYCNAFGATELERMAEPDGKVTHALLKIGDSMVRLSDDGSKHAAEWVAKGWSRADRHWERLRSRSCGPAPAAGGGSEPA